MGNTYSEEFVKATENYKLKTTFDNCIAKKDKKGAENIRLQIVQSLATSILKPSKIDFTSAIIEQYDAAADKREKVGYIINGLQGISYAPPLVPAKPYIDMLCSYVDSLLQEDRLVMMEKTMFKIAASLGRETDYKICKNNLHQLKVNLENVRTVKKEDENRKKDPILNDLDKYWITIKDPESDFYRYPFLSTELIGMFMVIYLYLLHRWYPDQQERLKECKIKALELFQDYKRRAISDRVDYIKLHIDYKQFQTGAMVVGEVILTLPLHKIQRGREIQKRKNGQNSDDCQKLSFILEDTLTNKIYFDYFIHYSWASPFIEKNNHLYKEMFGNTPPDTYKIPKAIFDDFYDPFFITDGLREDIRRQLTEKYEAIEKHLEAIIEYVSGKSSSAATVVNKILQPENT